ncbi:hypothetical protein GHT06_014030 [Daphnia sinensis]|uniref:J domain-containing protein n=1 Tax=Daphnia sinensis TaxID=1820382 RepID=A0AAD5LC69_9CRUS|nr:hypothetical protein GHT06_014030 [Daphnia sinensis]
MIMFVCYLGCGAVKSSRNSTGALSIRLPRRFLSSKQIRPPVNHYEILGLTSKSTQAEIKASFYKLSKVFHPDVSDQSEESAVKFRQITTAYEILGNLKLRKMYDKGLLPRDGLISQEVDVAYEDCETQSPFKKTRSQPATGRTTVYDYDQWSRLHYGTTLNRRTVAKEKWQSKYDARINETEFKKSDNAIAFVLLSIIILAGLHMLGKPNYDVIKENYKRP